MVSESNPSSRRKILHYDSFSSGSGYGLEDYTRRWNLVFGLDEFVDRDTRIFDNTSFSVSAIPFRSSVDDGVLDHMKYLAASTETFRVPANGSITVEATVTARPNPAGARCARHLRTPWLLSKWSTVRG